MSWLLSPIKTYKKLANNILELYEAGDDEFNEKVLKIDIRIFTLFSNDNKIKF